MYNLVRRASVHQAVPATMSLLEKLPTGKLLGQLESTWGEQISDFVLLMEKIGNAPKNPGKGKKTRPTWKISVALPPDDWLCTKMDILNLEV